MAGLSSRAEIILRSTLLKWMSSIVNKEIGSLGDLSDGIVYEEALSIITNGNYIPYDDYKARKKIRIKVVDKRSKEEKRIFRVLNYLDRIAALPMTIKEASMAILSESYKSLTIIESIIRRLVLNPSHIKRLVNDRLPSQYEISNFDSDWRDGIRLGGLAEFAFPDQDQFKTWQKWDPENSFGNIENVMDKVQEYGISKFFEASDMQFPETPEICILLYVNQFFRFSGLRNKLTDDPYMMPLYSDSDEEDPLYDLIRPIYPADDPTYSYIDISAERAKVLFDYNALMENELSLTRDTIITVLNKNLIGWWMGEANGKRGLFPSNYVELIPYKKISPLARRRLPSPPPEVPDRKTKYNHSERKAENMTKQASNPRSAYPPTPSTSKNSDSFPEERAKEYFIDDADYPEIYDETPRAPPPPIPERPNNNEQLGNKGASNLQDIYNTKHSQDQDSDCEDDYIQCLEPTNSQATELPGSFETKNYEANTLGDQSDAYDDYLVLNESWKIETIKVLVEKYNFTSKDVYNTLYPPDALVINTSSRREGHMSYVNKARIQTKMHGFRPAAAKSMKDAKNTLHVLKEADILMNLRHENIVSLMGLVYKDDVLYLLVPWMEKGDLKTFLKKHADQLSKERKYVFALDIAQGMEYLSDRDIVHRDLAARNCLIDKGLRIKISDFALTRDTFLEPYIRKSDTDWPYQSAAFESLVLNEYTTRSDVWSFGVLLWEIISDGAEPYCGMELGRVIHYLTKGNRLPQPKQADDAVYALMLTCWNENPDDRPTFADIIESIEEQLMAKDETYIRVAAPPLIEPRTRGFKPSLR